MIRQMHVAIIGQGYVGLTITEGAIKSGHQVLGVDANPSVVASLNSGASHIEGVPNESIFRGISHGLFKATTDFSLVSGTDFVVIAVPTPLDGDGKPDLAMLKSACESIAPYLGTETLVINESTSFIGTLRKIGRAHV